MSDELLIGNDMQIKFADDNKLLDTNNDPISGATVNATVLNNKDLSEVIGPITLTEGSNAGEYFGVISGDVEIYPDKLYIVDVEVEARDGTKARWRRKVTASYRT